VCFPEAERRRRIPAGVVVTVETPALPTNCYTIDSNPPCRRTQLRVLSPGFQHYIMNWITAQQSKPK
jgi:hypothetical protein